MRLIIYFCCVLVIGCNAKSLPDEEDSVVSIYTTLPPTVQTNKPLDVYHQIANNLAERITSPIFRFLGLEKNKTDKQWDTIELLDEEPMKDAEPVDNNLEDRDVEVLSVEALKKDVKKPEKITFYTNYLPPKESLEMNSTMNNVDNAFDDEPFEFEDAGEKPQENKFIYFLEILSSVVRLAWGAVVSYFSNKNQV